MTDCRRSKASTAVLRIEFGLHYRVRLLDDVTFGYYTHREPNYVVIDSIYEEAVEGPKYSDRTHTKQTSRS